MKKKWLTFRTFFNTSSTHGVSFWMSNTMGDDGFYITLPWNSSHSVYPGNEISDHYRTKLARPLIPKGDWQVGLSEFQYPEFSIPEFQYKHT